MSGATVGPILQAVGAVVSFFYPPVGIVISMIGAAITADAQEGINRRRAIRAYNESLQDRSLTVRSAVSPRRFVLGRVRLGGTLAYLKTVGTEKEKLDQATILCDGPIAGIAGMWLDENFVPAASFASGQPQTGQFSASNRKAMTGHGSAYLDNTNTFVAPHAPRSADPEDITVSGDLGSGFETLAVANVAGTAVTLAANFSGFIHYTYQWMHSEGLYTVQWHLGGRQQLNSPWPGVSTPDWSTDHRLQGIAYLRSLCDWDENIFYQGKPMESVLVDGVIVHDQRYNLNPCQAVTGAGIGAPGTLPANFSVTGMGNGIAREVVGFGSEDGVPYVDLRFYGTATSATSFQVRLPTPSASPAAAPAQSWSARAHVRLLSGVLTQFTTANLALMSYDSGGSGTIETTTALSADTVALPLRDAVVQVTDASLGASAVQAGAQVRFNVANATALDVTLRIGRPQLWRTDDPMRWSSNPAILAGWWMTLPRRDGGMGIPFDWVDWSSITAAANICDETISVKKVDGSGYEDIKRYECHTVLSTDVSALDNLAIILTAMAGSRAYTAGKYRIFAGAYRAPTYTLTDTDVVKDAPLRFQPQSSTFDNPPNVMNGRIIDAAKGYVETGVTPVVNDVYIELDGAEEPDEVDLPATTDGRQSQYLMGVELERRRPRMAGELTVTGRGADVALGDTLLLDLQGYEDFAALAWEVVDRGNRFDGTYWLRLVEMRATDYALDADRFTPIDQPLPPDNSHLWDVAELTTFSATSAPPTRLPDGTLVLRIACTWDLHPQAYVRQSGAIDIRWRKVDSDAWSGPVTVAGDATSADITVGAVDAMRYVVQAQARNGVPAFSEWVTDLVDVSSDTIIDGIDLVLGARAIVLPADTSGNVTSFAAATCSLAVVRNGVHETGSWALSRVNSSGVGSSISGTTLSITSMTNTVDAGYVDVTATRSGYPTQTQRLSIGKARAGADGSSAFTATATANMTWSGGVATKISGGGTWNGSVRSDQAYPGGAGCAFVADQATAKLKIALNSDPATDNNYTSLDYAIFLDSDGTLSVYESGTYTTHGTYGTGDVFAIIYNGESVTYYRNGSSFKTTAAAAGMLLYLDSSFRDLGSVSNLTFYPQAAKGSDAKLLQLSVTSQVFQVSKAGSASPSSVTFNANAQNLDGSPSFSVTAGTATLTGSGTSRTLTFANLSTDTATIQVSQDGLTDSITVAKVREGADAVMALLSNEAMVLPATSAGVVTSYAGAVSSMTVFLGATNDNANWAFSRTNGSGVTSTLSGNVVTITALADGTDASYVDMTATRSGYPTQSKRVTITKAKAGANGGPGLDGADAPLLTLSATSQIFTFDGTNTASPSSQTITLTAVLANLTGTASFTCTRYDSSGTSIGTVTLGGTGNARTLTVAQFGAAAFADVTASLSGRSDTVRLVRVRDGANSVVSDLTNDTHTLPADSQGNVVDYAGASTRMVVYLGTVDDSMNWSFSITPSTGVTATIGSGSDKNLVTVTSMSNTVEVGYVDVTATRSGFDAQTKRFSLAKSRSAQGTSGFIQGHSISASHLAFSGTPTARIRIRSNGELQRRSGTGAYITTSAWWSPPTLGIGNNWHIRVLKASEMGSGGSLTGPAFDTWHPVSSDLEYVATMNLVSAYSVDLVFQWSEDGGTTIEGSGKGWLYVERA